METTHLIITIFVISEYH